MPFLRLVSKGNGNDSSEKDFHKRQSRYGFNALDLYSCTIATFTAPLAEEPSLHSGSRPIFCEDAQAEHAGPMRARK